MAVIVRKRPLKTFLEGRRIYVRCWNKEIFERWYATPELAAEAMRNGNVEAHFFPSLHKKNRGTLLNCVEVRWGCVTDKANWKSGGMTTIHAEDAPFPGQPEGGTLVCRVGHKDPQPEVVPCG